MNGRSPFDEKSRQTSFLQRLQHGRNIGPPAIAGLDTFEGTDTFKLKITMPNGDTYVYYLDTDYYVPIKIDTKRIVRGAEREYETVLGDYKQVAGWYLPYSYEIGVKGSQDKAKTVYEKIEANVAIDDSRFGMPIIPKPSGQRP